MSPISRVAPVQPSHHEPTGGFQLAANACLCGGWQKRPSHYPKAACGSSTIHVTERHACLPGDMGKGISGFAGGVNRRKNSSRGARSRLRLAWRSISERLRSRSVEATSPDFTRTLGLRWGAPDSALPASVRSTSSGIGSWPSPDCTRLMYVVIGQEMPIKVADYDFTSSRAGCGSRSRRACRFQSNPRNCLTNDLLLHVRCNLLDAVDRHCGADDLSHYVVDREMPCPPHRPSRRSSRGFGAHR